jgi:hypothetical protein
MLGSEGNEEVLRMIRDEVVEYRYELILMT